MKITVHRGAIFVFVLIFMACTQEPENKIMIFAASSTTVPISRLAADFEKTTGIPVSLNFASSSFLARQILSGANFDLYFSANQKWMDQVVKAGLIEESSRHSEIQNDLVWVAKSGTHSKFRLHPKSDLTGFLPDRIALGDPVHVPAGIYAKEALLNLGLWQGVQAALVPTLNVRAALFLAERGDVAAAIVYSSDASQSRKVDLLARFPNESHEPIIFHFAPSLKASIHARNFLDYVLKNGEAVFVESGFRWVP